MLPLWHRRVSRYIDSIILNGLIKCILNNTKLEKKGTTNCIYSVLRKCCYSFNFICDIIIIFPPFPARGRVREPSVNTIDGSAVAELLPHAGWGWGEGLGSPGVLVMAAGGTSSECQPQPFSENGLCPQPGQLPALRFVRCSVLRALHVLWAAQQWHLPWHPRDAAVVTKPRSQQARGVELFLLVARAAPGLRCLQLCLRCLP